MFDYSSGGIDKQEVLNDAKSGKRKDWKRYKVGSMSLSESYVRLGLLEKSYRVKECASWLHFRQDGDGLRLHRADFCRVPLCPMCTWRRSLKIFGQVNKVMSYVQSVGKYKYLFLTLTLRNMPGDLLDSDLDKLFSGFHLMTKYKEFKGAVRGWFRCLEVTHNWERDDYHPHLHVILLVDEDYAQSGKVYITHKRWVKLWQSALKIDYEPSVRIQAVKSKSGEVGSYKNAVAEVAKYAVKSDDYISSLGSKTDEVVHVLDSALHRRRLIAFGGELKKAHKILNLDDTENGDLVNNEIGEELREDLNYVLVTYRWMPGLGNYFMKLGEN